MNRVTWRKFIVILAVCVAGVAGWLYFGAFPGVNASWGRSVALLQEEQSYEFVYTLETEIALDDGQEIPGRAFMLTDGTLCFVPAGTGKGGPIMTRTESMEPNQMVLRRMKQPAISIAGKLYQEEFDYLELQYNVATSSDQEIYPKVAPARSCW